MLASEKKRLRSSCHSSCCSSSWLPTNLMIEVSLGKMPTLVRRLIDGLAERTSRCDVKPLEWVGAPDLAPMLVRGMELDEVFSVGVGQHVFLGGIHHRHGAGELLAQHRRDLLPVGPHQLGFWDDEHSSRPPAWFYA